MKNILEASPYLAEQLSKHPEWQIPLSQAQPYQNGELAQGIHQRIQACTNETQLLSEVRQTRHYEMCRIAWRELSGTADLQQTLHDTSTLADSLISSVLIWWHEQLCDKYGVPCNAAGDEQQLLVLGMGKLGGQELNFSSDIDLIFTFPEAGQTKGQREVDNQAFFIRLGQKLIHTLSQVTPDGFAYRVDMRLRPFGDVGALALSFDAMEHYYQTHGREWERYAMIKARVISANNPAAQELMQRLRPFIYRRYLDYGAVEQLRDMKQMINREAEKRGKRQDIKLGVGGIREIEFIAQVFQLMRGGREPLLQQRSLLPTLANLATLALLSPHEVDDLRQAYCFLRKTENRLQMWRDEQTHVLPQQSEQQGILAQSMGFKDWTTFKQQLDIWRQCVSNVFKRIFTLEQDANKPKHFEFAEQIWHGYVNQTKSQQLLQTMGYQHAAETREKINQLRDSRLYQSLTETGRQRFDKLLPILISVCAEQTLADSALERSLSIVQAIARRSVYMSLLIDNPNALHQLVRLVSQSSLITSRLAQHPILLDELIDTRELYQPLARHALQLAIQQDLARINPQETEALMERLRQFKQAQMLKVAAADISQAMPLMKVSDQLTWIAEVILEVTWQHVWELMVAKHGKPCYSINEQQYEAGFAIIGYGKLGGLELGYSSDLDIIFLHDASGSQQQTTGDKPIENGVFYARLSQRIIHILSAFTYDGRLYETDTRLRPSGASGLLVSSLEAFRTYQYEKAWIWEHQALLRARALTGTADLLAKFEAVRQAILCQPRDPEVLLQEVVQMRQKMWQNLGNKDDSVFHLKKDTGGITDIEFLVQYLILAHAHQYPALVQWSDNIRQLQSLAQCGLLLPKEVERLADIYRTMRQRMHALALQEQKAFVSADEYREERDYVQACWAKYLK